VALNTHHLQDSPREIRPRTRAHQQQGPEAVAEQGTALQGRPHRQGASVTMNIWPDGVHAARKPSSCGHAAQNPARAGIAQMAPQHQLHPKPATPRPQPAASPSDLSEVWWRCFRPRNTTGGGRISKPSGPGRGRTASPHCAEIQSSRAGHQQKERGSKGLKQAVCRGGSGRCWCGGSGCASRSNAPMAMKARVIAATGWQRGSLGGPNCRHHPNRYDQQAPIVGVPALLVDGPWALPWRSTWPSC